MRRGKQERVRSRKLSQLTYPTQPQKYGQLMKSVRGDKSSSERDFSWENLISSGLADTAMRLEIICVCVYFIDFFSQVLIATKEDKSFLNH